jgi:GDP-L-fucose synthase
MIRVLLTGGSGFLGRNILESDLASKYEIFAPTHEQLDLMNDVAVGRYVERGRFDIILHTAIKPAHRMAKDHTGIFFENTRMLFILDALRDTFGKLILIGSGSVYDQRRYKSKMTESSWEDHIPFDELGLYKYACAKVASTSSTVYELRLFGIYGPYEDYRIRFISNMICKALFDFPLTINQDRLFDYIWIGDLMHVLKHFIEVDVKHHCYNVTPDSSVTLSSIAELVLEVTGKTLPVIIDSNELGLEYSGDNSRLRKEMPGLKFTSLRDGISKLVMYYETNRHKIDVHYLESNY